jgi:hypothetical protein
LYIDGVDQIFRVDPNDWSVSVFADSNDSLSDCGAMEFSPSNTLLCTNYKTDELFEFDSGGTGSVLYDATNGLSGPLGLEHDASGNLLVVNGMAVQILSFPVGGGVASVVADAGDGMLSPTNIAIAPDGSLFVTDFYLGVVWSIDVNGLATVFDTILEPQTVAIRRNGDIYIVAGGTASGGSGKSVFKYPSGDASQRENLVSFPGAAFWGAIQFSLDQRTVYYASDDELYTIDADTGASTKVVDNSKGLAQCWAISVVPFRASWSNYGSGFPGSNGVPAMTSRGNPMLGTTGTVDVANSYGQPTIGLLFAGFQQASMHSAWGGDLLVVPTITLPITFSYGANSFSGSLPDDPLLMGTKLDLQVIEADPGAAKGVSFTQGLELVLGY